MTMNDTYSPRFRVALALVGTLIGCSESNAIYQADAAPADSGGGSDVSVRDSVSVDSASIDATTSEADAGRADASPSMDADVIADAGAADVPEDATLVRYERDVRPLLEASACNDCHSGEGIEMDYAWISAPGDGWCDPIEYERRWNCVEVHARTQTVDPIRGCESDFYHRHGEPCFMEEARLRVLAWAADGYLE